MYEVNFAGWTRSPESINEMKKFRVRWKQHFITFYKAIKYRRWTHFNYHTFKGLIFNLRKTYYD